MAVFVIKNAGWQFVLSWEHWKLGCAEGLQAVFVLSSGSHRAVRWHKMLETLSCPGRRVETFSHLPASVSKLIPIPRHGILITFLCLGIMWTFNEKLVRREGEVGFCYKWGERKALLPGNVVSFQCHTKADVFAIHHIKSSCFLFVKGVDRFCSFNGSFSWYAVF